MPLGRSQALRFPGVLTLPNRRVGDVDDTDWGEEDKTSTPGLYFSLFAAPFWAPALNLPLLRTALENFL